MDLGVYKYLYVRKGAHIQPMAASQKMPCSGRAEAYIGPMFSGKTSEIARSLERARIAGLPCVFVKNADDTRFSTGESTETHNGTRIQSESATGDLARLRVVIVRKLLDIELGEDEFDIGVDEGQFYPDLREAVDLWTREGRRIYIAALDGDFRRKPFETVSETLPLCSAITKLSAVCMLCPPGTALSEAPYTVRTDPSEDQKLIGAKDAYKAACPICYHKAT